MRSSWGTHTYASGPFSITADGSSVEWGGSGNTTVYKVSMSLNKSNNVYKSNSAVVPKSTSIKYFIKY